MREIALILLLILPSWGIFDNSKNSLKNYVKPKPQVDTVEKRLDSIIPEPTFDKSEEYKPSARASYSIDLSTNKILLQNNSTERLSVASLTKLMTAYVFLKNTKDLDEIVTVPTIKTQVGDALMGLYPGERIKKRDLLSGLLINSGSDAATAIAVIDSGDIEAFVSKMNQAVVDIGLPNTNFKNPVGWDETGNYSSAKDVAEISRILLRNNFFSDTVATRQKTVYTENGRPIYLNNTNILLDNTKYFGVKTGYTLGAGECLTTLESVDGNQIITVILGANGRFSETNNINSWIFTHNVW